jgi:hypothetical protein
MWQGDQQGFQTAQMRGTVFVRVAARDVTAGFTVTLGNDDSVPPVCIVPCDTVLHHQIKPQVFSYDDAAGTIMLDATKECLTYSKVGPALAVFFGV